MKFYCFLIKHKLVPLIIFGVMIICTEVFLIYKLFSNEIDDLSYILYTIILALLMIIFRIAVDIIPSIPARKAIKELDENCDPYPLEAVYSRYINCTKKENLRLLYYIDLSVAYSGLGKYNEALNLLLSYNPEFVEKQHPRIKHLYYHNITSMYLNLKDAEKAEYYLNKTKQIRNTIKRIDYDMSVLHQADLCLLKGDYKSCLELLNSYVIKSKRISVNMAHSAAQALIGLGNTDEAKAQLNYVIANGNKLYVVKEAEKLLDSLS